MKKVPTHLIHNTVALETYEVTEFYNRAEAERDLRSSKDLNASMEIVGQQFHYYADLHAQAENQYGIFSELVEITSASLDKHYRTKLGTTGERVTEKLVSANVTLDPRMQEVNRLARDAKAQVNYLKGTCDALKQRKDALIALSYNMREAMKGDPTVSGSRSLSRQFLSGLSNDDFGLPESD